MWSMHVFAADQHVQIKCTAIYSQRLDLEFKGGEAAYVCTAWEGHSLCHSVLSTFPEGTSDRGTLWD